MSKNTPSSPNPATVALIAELNLIRGNQGLNQGEVARRAGKSANMGYKFFDTYRNPKVDSVVEFAAALGYKLALVPKELPFGTGAQLILDIYGELPVPKRKQGKPTHLVTVVQAVEL